MVEYRDTRLSGVLHPLHAILLAFVFPMSLGALLSDWAYSSTYEIQWTNFAEWLIAGALVFGGFALIWAFVDWMRTRAGLRGRSTLYLLLLLGAWVIGFFNALIHARDAWATMPLGLILSLIVAVLAFAASWVGYSGYRTGEVV